MSSSHLSDLDCSFFPDPFFPFTNDLILLSLQETPETNYHQYQYTTQSHLLNPVENIHLEETFSNSSPPSHLMENLSISQEITRLQNAPPPPPPHHHQCLSSAFGTISGETDTTGDKGRTVPTILVQNSRKIRRDCSTGDLQRMKGSDAEKMSPLSREKVMMMEEEASFKIGRCGAEERKEKIQKYRAKRMHRNFNKTIKQTAGQEYGVDLPAITRLSTLQTLLGGSNEMDESDEEI